MSRMEWYASKINEVLTRRRVIESPLVWGGWAGPEFMGPKTYAFVVDLDRFPGKRIEVLHHPKVISDISTVLGGIKVGHTNTRGFAFIVKEEPVPKLYPVDLLEYLTKNPRALVAGSPGTGKTSLLQYLIDKKRGEKIVVFDPKPRGENNWLHARPMGLGANWAEIERALTDIEKVFRWRLRNGTGVPILIIADEYWSTAKHIENYSARLLEILATGRTSNLNLVVGTHSQRVKGMGIEGEGDILDGFVKVHLVKVRNRFEATIDYGDGPIPAQHPGPFFSEDDTILVKLAVYRNDGYCSVGKIENLVKSDRMLKHRFWNNGGPFTYHRLQARFKEWEAKGWLTPPGQLPNGQKVGRMVTDELKKRSGLL